MADEYIELPLDEIEVTPNNNYIELPLDEVSPSSVISTQPTEPTILEEAGRQAGIIARGAGPALLGARIGRLAGPYGAVIGAGGLTAAELGAAGLRGLGFDVGSPYEKLQQSLSKIGLPQAETPGERTLQAASEGISGAKTFATGIGELGKRYGSKILSALGAAPTLQRYGAGTSAGTSQLVGEKYGTGAGLAAGLGTSLAFAPFAGKKTIGPSVSQIKSESGQLYKFAEEAGIKYSPVSTQNLFNDLYGIKNIDTTAVTKNKAGRYTNTQESTTPKSLQISNLISSYEGKSLGLPELDNLRQSINALIPKANNKDKAILVQMKKKIDGFVNDSGVTALDQSALGQIKSEVTAEKLNKARELWNKSEKVKRIENIFNTAEIKNAATGAEAEKAVRSRIANIVADEEQMKLYSQAEQDAMKKLIQTGGVKEFLTSLSRSTSGLSAFRSTAASGGLGALFGGIFGGPAGVAIGGAIGTAGVPIAGSIAGMGERAITRSRMNDLLNTLRLGRQPGILENIESRFINPALVGTRITGAGAEQSLLTPLEENDKFGLLP